MVYSSKDINKAYYTTREVSDIFGVSPKTVQGWDRRGVLKFQRTSTNRRILPKEDLVSELKARNMYMETDTSRKDVIYARVSTLNQKEQGDLDRQVLYILENVKDLVNVEVIKEHGSGLNSRRKGLLKLLDNVIEDKVSRIFITYKERLTRFGYEYIERICDEHGVEIIILHKDEEKSNEEELVEDMMSLLASFSRKWYGMRSHSNKKKRIEELLNKVLTDGEDNIITKN